MNTLEITTNWVEANQQLKNVNNRLKLYPNDAKLRQEKEILEETIRECEQLRGN